MAWSNVLTVWQGVAVMSNPAQRSARRLLDREASEYVRGLLARDVLRLRLQALAETTPEADRLARLLEEGVPDD